MKKHFLILVFLLIFLSGCSSQPGAWGWYVIDPTNKCGYNNVMFLLSVFSATIQISLLSDMSSNYWVRLPSRTYIEFIRAVPLLPMMFWIFYGLPVILKSMGLNIPIDPFWGAVVTLAISDSAFTAEIYRAGIQSIHKGQREAAQTIGLTSFQTMRYVILPQAIKRILPPLANQFIYIVKMSAFASVIGMQELMRRANEVVVSEYRPLEVYTFLIFEYLILVLIISQAVRWLERKMGSDESRG